MSRRVIVTVHLPLEMGAVGRILKAIAREYPDAEVKGEGGSFEVIAEADGPPRPRRRRP